MRVRDTCPEGESGEYVRLALARVRLRACMDLELKNPRIKRNPGVEKGRVELGWRVYVCHYTSACASVYI